MMVLEEQRRLEVTVAATTDAFRVHAGRDYHYPILSFNHNCERPLRSTFHGGKRS